MRTILEEVKTDDGYLLQLTFNLYAFDFKEHAYEVWSIAPDGYKTISEETHSIKRARQAMKFLAEPTGSV